MSTRKGLIFFAIPKEIDALHGTIACIGLLTNVHFRQIEPKKLQTFTLHLSEMDGEHKIDSCDGMLHVAVCGLIRQAEDHVNAARVFKKEVDELLGIPIMALVLPSIDDVVAYYVQEALRRKPILLQS